MAKQKENDKVKTTHERHLLKCELSQDELLQCGDELAGALDNLRQAQEEKESVVKDFKAKEAMCEAEITTKQLLVRNKYEYRQTDCKLILDYTKQSATLIRLDTEGIVNERQLSEEEKQMDLGFDGEEQV